MFYLTSVMLSMLVVATWWGLVHIITELVSGWLVLNNSMYVYHSYFDYWLYRIIPLLVLVWATNTDFILFRLSYMDCCISRFRKIFKGVRQQCCKARKKMSLCHFKLYCWSTQLPLLTLKKLCVLLRERVKEKKNCEKALTKMVFWKWN